MSAPLCATCPGEVVATHFTEPSDLWDPCCDSCYAARFEACPTCGAIQPKDDIRPVLVLRATRYDPEEHEDRCPACGPSENDEPGESEDA